MNALSSSAPVRFSGRRAQSIAKTSAPAALYRDVSLDGFTRKSPAARGLGRVLPIADAGSDQADHALLLGLSVLTVPAIAYSLTQLWTLLSGDTLPHAIRAFLP